MHQRRNSLDQSLRLIEVSQAVRGYRVDQKMAVFLKRERVVVRFRLRTIIRKGDENQNKAKLTYISILLCFSNQKKMSISKVSDMKHHVRLAGNSCFPSDFLRNFQIFCSRLILDPKACVLFSERTRWRQSGAGHQVKKEKQRAELTRLLV
ncbi:uncharacterized protein METZ01_LOCUS513362 [marine metagenome]|uniref:Uncharacterized protein n=1 Tax=marine metagenome TaxID=408172 RepID=A0A383EWN2_9ZZZZ